MFEEIANKPIRMAKINRFKGRVLIELRERLANISDMMRVIDKDEQSNFAAWVFENFVLTSLASYLFESYSMTKEVNKNESVGLVVYAIPTETIDVWLQDDYDFVERYLQWCYQNKPKFIPVLTDEIMAHYLVTPIELALYEYRKEMKE